MVLVRALILCQFVSQVQSLCQDVSLGGRQHAIGGKCAPPRCEMQARHSLEWNDGIIVYRRARQCSGADHGRRTDKYQCPDGKGKSYEEPLHINEEKMGRTRMDRNRRQGLPPTPLCARRAISLHSRRSNIRKPRAPKLPLLSHFQRCPDLARTDHGSSYSARPRARGCTPPLGE